jgi:hypothetical protein
MKVRLVTGEIDFNDASTGEKLWDIFCALAKKPDHYRKLSVLEATSFALQDSEAKLPREPGWYVLLSGVTPIHVNQASDLDRRLDSPSGGLDYFKDDRRRSDPERNFIKRLHDLGAIRDLRVWFITAEEVAQELRISIPLGPLDTENVAKWLNIIRGFIQFL